MRSPDSLIGLLKLPTKSFPRHVEHTTHSSDPSLGMGVKWYRVRELGNGGFGTVWLEMSETHELRAVKTISKGPGWDYNRQLKAMAELTKVESHC
jgi:hypothetical protein